MRVQFHFAMESGSIPIFYRLGMLAIIKDMVRKGSASFYDDFFEERKSKMKSFCSAVYIPGLEIKEDELVGNQLKLTISSSDYEFMLHLLNGCKRGDVYNISQSSLRLTSIVLLPRKKIKGNVVTFKTMSPIHVESKAGKPLIATDADFDKELKYIANLILREVCGREPKIPIQVTQKMLSKRVIKEHLHQLEDNPLYITANSGYIQLSGDPEDLQVFYDIGLSLRRSLGFGLLEVVEEVS